MKQLTKCFWCNTGLLDEEVTRDHIIPKGTGGLPYGETVPACAKCNQERGLVTETEVFYLSLLAARHLLHDDNHPVNDNSILPRYLRRANDPYAQKKYIKKMTRVFNKKFYRMDILRRYWAGIEQTKLGYSILADYSFALIGDVHAEIMANQ